MIILSIKTDQPTSQFGLYNDQKLLVDTTYLAHRDLANTIHKKIDKLLKSQKLDWNNIEGVICFKGPGSFTGLRIGLTLANTLAYGLNIPIIGASGTNWVASAVKELLEGQNDQIVIPNYGAEPHITLPKK